MSTNGQLKALIERIEREEEQKAEIAAGIKEIYMEGKSAGYDVKILRKIIAVRKKDPAARAEEAAIMETYLAELGMQP
jgi:uncharacterized protein (UPF0335 family)